jgi:hypothetical protein
MKLGAPFGNKNALGNDGGRPPLYDDAESLQMLAMITLNI